MDDGVGNGLGQPVHDAVAVPSGLEVLTLPGMTETGCVLPESLPLDQWRRLLRSVCAYGRAVPWIVGDLLAFGERVYGETYAQFAEETGYDVQTLQTWRYVADRFPETRRRHGEHQSWSHHAVVANLPAPEADAWLDRAKEQAWSEKALRAARKAARALETTSPTAVWKCDTCRLPLEEIERRAREGQQP